MTEEFDRFRVELLIGTRRYDDAVRMLQTRLASTPDDAIAAAMLARTYLGAGRQAEALGAAQRAMALDPMQVPVQEVRAIALHNLHRDHEALPVARWIAAQEPDSWSSWRLLALVSPEPVEAYAAGERAVVLAPDEPQAHLAFGQALLRAGRSKEAEVAFRRSLALAPDNANAQNLAGIAALRQGDAAGAAVGFRAAIGADPNASFARSNLLIALQVAVRPFVLGVWIAALVLNYAISGLSTTPARIYGVAAGTTLVVLLVGCVVRFLRKVPGGSRQYARLLRGDTRLLAGIGFLAVALALIWTVAVIPGDVGPLALLAGLTALAGAVLFQRGARWRPWWWPRR